MRIDARAEARPQFLPPQRKCSGGDAESDRHDAHGHLWCLRGPLDQDAIAVATDFFPRSHVTALWSPHSDKAAAEDIHRRAAPVISCFFRFGCLEVAPQACRAMGLCCGSDSFPHDGTDELGARGVNYLDLFRSRIYLVPVLVKFLSVPSDYSIIGIMTMKQ